METVTIVLWIAAGVLIVIGALGMILPVLPGAPLIFIGALLAAWAEEFQYLGYGSLILLGRVGNSSLILVTMVTMIMLALNTPAAKKPVIDFPASGA